MDGSRLNKALMEWLTVTGQDGLMTSRNDADFHRTNT